MKLTPEQKVALRERILKAARAEIADIARRRQIGDRHIRRQERG